MEGTCRMQNKLASLAGCVRRLQQQPNTELTGAMPRAEAVGREKREGNQINLITM